jgi:hypothetical protein
VGGAGGGGEKGRLLGRRRRRRRLTSNRLDTSFLVTRFRLRKNSSFLSPMVRRSTTSSPSMARRPSALSNTTSTNADMTLAPAPSCSICCRSSCRKDTNLGDSRTNWIASKKLDLPDPLRPTMALCLGLEAGARGSERRRGAARQRGAAGRRT